MKKVITLLLSLALLLGILPVSALATEWTEAPEFAMTATREDDTITLKLYPKTEFVFSSLGFNVAYPDDKVTLVENMNEDDENYIVVLNKVSNTKFPTMNITPGNIAYAFAAATNTTFAAEKPVLTVHFTVNAGVGGKIDFAVTNLNAGQTGDISKIYPSSEFPTASVTIPKAPITTVTASVDAPVKGKALDTTVDIGTATGYTSKVEWYKGNTATGTAMTGPAAANQVYTAKITLTASSGESFAKGVTTPTSYTKVSANETTIVLTKTFPATAEKTLTGITIKTCLHTTYTAGEQFNKAGMVITAAYDDGSTKDVQPTYFQFTPTALLTVNDKEVTITYTEGNVTQIAKQKITVNPKALTASMVRDIAAQTYTGSLIVPELTVKDGEIALSKDTDYTVKYQNNLNAGTATVTLTGKGNYSGSVNKDFTIKEKDVTAQRDATDIQVVVDKGTFDAPTFGDVTGTLTYSYAGATSYDAIVAKLKTLQLGATGDIGYTYTANGNYTGIITGTLHFTVVNLPAATITTAPAAKSGLTFNGTEQVLVNAGSGITGGTLQYKLDGGSYNAELPKATNAGSYTVYYKVKGNNTTHSDSSEQSFTVTIAPKTVTAAVSVEPTSYTYTGEAIVPTTVTVKDGTTVIPASEYTVTYGNNTNAGKATVTVKDQDGGNYVVSGTATFTITKAALSGVSVSLGGWTYGDTAKTPTVSGNLGNANVTYQYKAVDAADETYTNVVPTNAGTYTVKATVAESANYKAATATGSFTIAPKTVTNAAVTLSQTSYAYTGRAFQPSVTVKDGTTVIPASEYTVAYTDNTNVGTATVTVSDRAGGNYVVSGTATFTITKAALSGVSVSLGGWTYGDTAKTPTVSGNLGNANVTYQYKAVDAADETYTNVVPTNAGTYTVKATVAESANYAAATATRNFTIVPKAISKATVENIGEQEFTGRTITPTVTVKDGTVVLTDADYSVAYANNIDAGTANVTITGKGNYTGSTSVKFTIAQAAAPVVVDDSGATVTAPDTTKENVAGKLDETGKTKYNKDSKGEVTTDEEIILGNVKKAMGVTGTNSTMITAQVTTSGSATKAMTVLPYAQGADSRKNFTVKKLNADGTIETIDSRNVVKMAAGLKLELEDGAIYAISWTTPSSSGSGRSYTSGQSFTTDLPADSINRVTVNGKKLDSKNYTVSSNGSGSIVTLLQSYLDTLKVGKYTVKIENKTHVSTGTFTIKADGTLSSPRTADAGVCLYAAMALMSGTGAAYVTLRRKKEN